MGVSPGRSLMPRATSQLTPKDRDGRSHTQPRRTILLAQPAHTTKPHAPKTTAACRSPSKSDDPSERYLSTTASPRNNRGLSRDQTEARLADTIALGVVRRIGDDGQMRCGKLPSRKPLQRCATTSALEGSANAGHGSSNSATGEGSTKHERATPGLSTSSSTNVDHCRAPPASTCTPRPGFRWDQAMGLSTSTCSGRFQLRQTTAPRQRGRP